MANTLVQFRTEETARIKAVTICEKLGIDLPTYLRMCIFRLVEENGVPFSMKVDDISESKGIKAMKALDDGSGIATPAMIMLIVLNATSIQLLPSTVIGLRASAGSASPADIILPTLIATFVTSCLGVLLVKLCNSFRAKHAKKSPLNKRGEQ